jgi:general secretion pathway protein G
MTNSKLQRTALGATARTAAAGFTVLQVMVVSVIIGLIAGSIGVTLFNQHKKSQVKIAKTTVGEISGAVQQYMMENNRKCPKGIEDLLAKKNLKEVLKDPWGKDFVIKCPGTNDTDGADITSSGPDKQDGTADDIKSWE